MEKVSRLGKWEFEDYTEGGKAGVGEARCNLLLNMLVNHFFHIIPASR